MFYTGWMSLTGLGSGCAFRCTMSTQYMAPGYLIDLCRPFASIDGRGHLRSANRGQLQVPRIHMTTHENCVFEHDDPSTWNALPNTQMQFTLFTYSKTFLLLVSLAHPARSRLLQLTRYINYLLTYLLTGDC